MNLFRNRSFQIGAILYLASLALRFALLYELKNLPTVVQCTVLDVRGNHEFALAILDGLRPTTFYKAPFYSYFIAAVYAVAGRDPFNARVVQILLTGFTPVVTFLIAQFWFGRGIGAIAGIVSVFFWTFLYFSVELLDTGLACLFYMLLLYVLLVMDDRQWKKWLVSGLLLGLGAITRPNILPFAPVLAVLAILATLKGDIARWAATSSGGVKGAEPGSRNPRRSPWGHAVRNAVVLTIGCTLPILPITLRNRIVGGEWVLLGAYGGMNLYVANNPYSDSKNGPLLVDDRLFIEPTSYDPNEVWARCCLNYYSAYRTAEGKLRRPPKPGEFSQVMGEMAWDFIRRNPDWLASHVARRLVWMFNTMEFPSNRNLYDFSQYSTVLTAASGLRFGVICPLGLLGLGLALTRRQYRTMGMAYFLGMFVSLVFPAAMFHITHRFRVPIVHLLMPFAAFGFVEVLRLFRSGVSWPRRLLTGGALTGLVIFSNGNWYDYWDTRGAHLQWAMVMACEKAGRQDMLPKAVEDFERALVEYGDASIPSDTQLVLKYGRPMTWLFRYYNRKENLPKALAYADIMLSREPLNPEAAFEALGLYIRINDRFSAMKVLELMSRGLGKQIGPAVLADALRAFGMKFGDLVALQKARELYEQASRLNPQEIRNYRAIAEIDELFKQVSTRPQSQPTSTRRGGG